MLAQVAPNPHPFTMTPLEIIPICVALSVCILILVLLWPMDEIPTVEAREEPPRYPALGSAPAPFDWSTDETVGAS